MVHYLWPKLGKYSLELAGVEEQVDGAIRFMRESGVTIEHFGDVS